MLIGVLTGKYTNCILDQIRRRAAERICQVVTFLAIFLYVNKKPKTIRLHFRPAAATTATTECQRQQPSEQHLRVRLQRLRSRATAGAGPASVGRVPASAALEEVRGRVRRLPVPHRPEDHHHLHGRRLVRSR